MFFKDTLENEIKRLEAQKECLETDKRYTRSTREIIVPFYERNLVELRTQLEKQKQ